MDIISIIFEFKSSPFLSKSVNITYFLSFGKAKTKSSTCFPEIVKISLNPIFSRATLSLFPSTINEKSDKSSTSFSIW